MTTRKWILGAALVVGLSVALIVSLSTGREDIARTVVAVAPLPGVESNAAFRLDVADQLASSPEVAAGAAAAVDEDALDPGEALEPGEVADAVEVQEEGQGLLEVEARADDGERAAAIADAFAGAYVAELRSVERRRLRQAIVALETELGEVPLDSNETTTVLEGRIGELRAAQATVRNEIDQVSAAEVTDPSLGSDLFRNLVIGALGALILGTLLALLAESLDRRLRRPEDLERVYGLPVLTRIPRSGMLAGGSKVTSGTELAAVSGFSREAEAFRTLRANLRYFGSGGGVGSVLVVSPLSGEGKSTTTRLLAVTMAAMGDSVCLVDADLRKGDLSAASTDTQEEGLSLVLAGFDLDDALIEVPAAVDPLSSRSRVLVELGSGPLPPNPSELLEGERMRWVIGELEQRFDTVLIDSPALASVSDALGLVGQVSGVLVVSALDRTTRNSAIAVRKQLAVLGARQLGVVANYWQPDREYSYHYGEPVQYRAAAAE